jgi:phospholipid/cholesterol/gamma-HCH transport system permease protein
MTAFLNHTFWALASAPRRKKQIFEQLYFVGYQSLFIICICVSFAAIVTVLESSFHMKLVIQSDSMVPGFSSILILRELGSVVTALLLTSRVGAGMAAEVGSMKVSEQIEALRLLGVNPYEYLVVPRFISCVFGTIILVAVANVVCLYASMLVCSSLLGMPEALFWQTMNQYVGFKDFGFSLTKAAAFGAVIPLISCYYGFKTETGAEGVGQATTQSVVIASVAIIMIDFILSYVFSYFY